MGKLTKRRQEQPPRFGGCFVWRPRHLVAAVLALGMLGGAAHARDDSKIPCADVTANHIKAWDEGDTRESRTAQMVDEMTTGWMVGWADAKGYPGTDGPFADNVLAVCRAYPLLPLGGAVRMVIGRN